jgi:hypothetical protein
VQWWSWQRRWWRRDRWWISEERDLSGVENGVLLCKESFRYSVVEVERSTKARKRRKKRERDNILFCNSVCCVREREKNYMAVLQGVVPLLFRR